MIGENMDINDIKTAAAIYNIMKVTVKELLYSEWPWNIHHNKEDIFQCFPYKWTTEDIPIYKRGKKDKVFKNWIIVLLE